MLGIFFFVFCSDPNIVPCGKITANLNGFWQKIPPAAAMAKTVDDAANYFSYLKLGMEDAAAHASLADVTGKDCVVKGETVGALLTVMGYKVFVAGIAFAKVLERHVKALIGNYVKLEAQVKASATPPSGTGVVPSLPDASQTNAGQSAIPPAPAPQQSAKPDPTTGQNTTADEQKLKKEKDIQAKAAGDLRAKQLRFPQLGETEKSDLASMDSSAYQRFSDEWNSISVTSGFFSRLVAGEKKVCEVILAAYPKMNDTQRQRLFKDFPIVTEKVILWIDEAEKALKDVRIKDEAVRNFILELWKVLDGPVLEKNEVPKTAWDSMMDNYYKLQFNSGRKKNYSKQDAPSFSKFS